MGQRYDAEAMSLMTQWEYCELRWQASSRYEAARPSVVFYRDPSKAWSPPDANPEQLALRLGMEGWELVSVVTYERAGIGSGPEVHWYFKRPLGGNGHVTAPNGNGARNGVANGR